MNGTTTSTTPRGTRTRMALGILALTLLLLAIGSGQAAADHDDNYTVWETNGCLYAHTGAAGYGSWHEVRCDSADLGYMATDGCYYHWDGAQYRQQVCYVVAANGDYLSWITYTDGAVFVAYSVGGAVHLFHFHVEGNVVWIEVAPSVDADGWMTLNDFQARRTSSGSASGDQTTVALGNQVVNTMIGTQLYGQVLDGLFD